MHQKHAVVCHAFQHSPPALSTGLILRAGLFLSARLVLNGGLVNGGLILNGGLVLNAGLLLFRARQQRASAAAIHEGGITGSDSDVRLHIDGACQMQWQAPSA